MASAPFLRRACAILGCNAAFPCQGAAAPEAITATTALVSCPFNEAAAITMRMREGPDGGGGGGGDDDGGGRGGGGGGGRGGGRGGGGRGKKGGASAVVGMASHAPVCPGIPMSAAGRADVGEDGKFIASPSPLAQLFAASPELVHQMTKDSAFLRKSIAIPTIESRIKGCPGGPADIASRMPRSAITAATCVNYIAAAYSRGEVYADQAPSQICHATSGEHAE
jgi:hypothetical protein